MSDIYADDPRGFFEELKKKLAKEPELSEKYIKGIVTRSLGDVKEIEAWMAEGIVKYSMDALGDGAWFEVDDARNRALMASSKVKGAGVRTGKPSLYLDTLTVSGNWGNEEFDAITSAGRYGKFFEKLFFQGGGGNEITPDITLTGEVTGSEGSKGVQIEIKQQISSLGAHLSGSLTAGKMGHRTLRDAWDNAESNAIRLSLARDVVAWRTTLKMANLLFASFVGPSASTVKWTPIEGEDGWEATHNKFFFNKLIYWFELLERFLVSIIEERLTVESMVIPKGQSSTTIEGMLKIKESGGVLDELEVKIRFSDMPDESDVRDIVLENADKLYLGHHVLFDDASPDAMKKGKEFFKRIVAEYKPFR